MSRKEKSLKIKNDVPQGTKVNSPPIYRWVGSKYKIESRKGRQKNTRDNFCRPLRDLPKTTNSPRD